MKKTKEKKKNKATTKSPSDLLIPIMLIICILPLVVRLAVYSCGYSDYEWYSQNDIIADFFCYYKSYLFDIVAIFSAIILIFRMGLYQEKTKPVKYFIPLAVYGIFVIASTIFSVNADASVKGNFESFESIFVLIGYVIMAFYAYQIMENEKDYKIVFYGIIILSSVLAIFGIFQILGLDLFSFLWFQRLIMSAEEFQNYAGEITNTFSGNNVYLTLYNPNYAAVVLSMLFAIIFVMFFTEEKKKNKLIYGIMSIILSILVWFTYSRASLITMLITIILTFVYQSRVHSFKPRYIIIAMLLLSVLLVGTDIANGSKYLSKIFEKNTREPLESMTTDEAGIHITYDKTDYTIWFDDKMLYCKNENDNTLLTAAAKEEMLLPMEQESYALLTEDELLIYIAQNTLNFINEDGTYYYKSPSQKICSMQDVEKADFHGLEYLGSARGYIWSRVVPLLDEYILIGSGPDTFAEVFPQNDYAGKIVYSDNAGMVIEKAHNDYLNKWVQTGLLSVLAMLTFYIIILITGKKAYFRQQTDSLKLRLGLGSYLACISYMTASLFNDSTIQSAPLFWIFSGITLSVSCGRE